MARESVHKVWEASPGQPKSEITYECIDFDEGASDYTRPVDLTTYAPEYSMSLKSALPEPQNRTYSGQTPANNPGVQVADEGFDRTSPGLNGVFIPSESGS